MLVKIFKTFYNRDLNKLKNEIELYKNENTIWLLEKQVANSAGNLCLHLIGNLNTYIGAELGNTHYIRNRDLEFSAKNVPRPELIKRIEDTIGIVDATLEKLTDEQLENEYPALVFNSKTSTAQLLVHLATHLNYHLGQINYHRRILEE